MQPSTAYSLTTQGVEAHPVTLQDIQALNYSSLFDEPWRSFYPFNCTPKAGMINMPVLPFWSMAKFETSLQDFQTVEEYDLIYFDAFVWIVSRNCGQKPLWIKCIWCWGMEVFSPHIAVKGSFKGLLSRLGLTWKVTRGPGRKRENNKGP